MRMPILLALLWAVSISAQGSTMATMPRGDIETSGTSVAETADEAGDALAEENTDSADEGDPVAVMDCGVVPEGYECVWEIPEDALDDPFYGEVLPLEFEEGWEYDNSGMLDGIYSCDLIYSSDGQSRSHAYISVNGRSNGDAVFIVGEVDNRPDAYFGYGIGRVSDETDGWTFSFSGNTSEGEPFTMTGTYQEDGSVVASGEAIVMFDAGNGEKVAVKNMLHCQSIW